MFQKEQFVEECLAALKESDTQGVILEIVEKAVATPQQVILGLGEPELAGVETIYRADDLTILNLVWGPHMEFYPHDHRVWAVIGIYCGCEDNTFYCRSKEGLAQHGSKRLNAKDAIELGETVIHAVTNPLAQLTGAIHVYGGDFFAMPRSEWDPETFEESPYDVEHALQAFEESNKHLRAIETRS